VIGYDTDLASLLRELYRVGQQTYQNLLDSHLVHPNDLLPS